MAKTNPADGRSRVKAGFRDSGQFMKEYHDPNLIPPDNSARDAESVKTCLEAFQNVANDLGATSDVHYGGRSVTYRVGADDQLEFRVWVDDDGVGFRGYGVKMTESGDFVASTDIETTDDLDSRSAKKFMQRVLLETHKIDRSEKWVENLSEDPEESFQWECAKFSPEESRAWIREYFGADEAVEWRNSGFEPKDARAWYSAEFYPFEAENWRDSGFDPESAQQWDQMQRYSSEYNIPLRMDQIQEWHKITPDAAVASKWINLFDSPDPEISQEWRKYGFSPEEYEQWFEFDPETARAKIDTGVDFETANAERGMEETALRDYWERGRKEDQEKRKTARTE
jgi:hypothetical protein